MLLNNLSERQQIAYGAIAIWKQCKDETDPKFMKFLVTACIKMQTYFDYKVPVDD